MMETELQVTIGMISVTIKENQVLTSTDDNLMDSLQHKSNPSSIPITPQRQQSEGTSDFPSLSYKTPKTTSEIRDQLKHSMQEGVGKDELQLLVQKLGKIALESKAESVLDKQSVVELADKLKEVQKNTGDRREIPFGFQPTMESIRKEVREREEADIMKKKKKEENAQKKREKELRKELDELQAKRDIEGEIGGKEQNQDENPGRG